MPSWRCFLVLGAVAAIPCELPAQWVSRGLALGIAVPTGDYAEMRRPGPLANLSVTSGGPERRIRFRLEGEGVWMASREDASPPPPNAIGDLRILSILASVLMTPSNGSVRPYVVVGAGPQWLTVRNGVYPYETVVGVRAALGLEGKWSGRILRAELGAHAVLSHDATRRNFGLGTFVPVMVGTQF